MERWIAITGGVLGATAVSVLLLHEVARLRSARRRSRRLAMFAPPLVLGFFGIVVIRLFDLL